MINTNSRSLALRALMMGAAVGAAGSAGASADAVVPMTKAQAAKAVRRPIFELVDAKDDAGNDIKVPKLARLAAIKESEVFGFKDYGDYVIVVTEDGQKFDSRDAAAEKAGK